MRAVAFLLGLFVAVAWAQSDPDRLLKRAIDAQERGDFPAAIRDYRRVLELRPEMVEAKVNLGAALVHVGQFDEAIKMYQSALPSLTQKKPVLTNLALAYYKKGDFQNAQEQFEALHKSEPNDVRIAILLGDTDIRIEKPDAAVTLLAPLEAGNMQNMDFEYVFGSALISSGNRREGVSRIERVAESSHSADAYVLAGNTLLQLNEFEQARHDLEVALGLNPKLPGIYTLVGTARDKTGDTEQAEPAFREALKVNPEDFDANLYLGAILLKRRQTEEAKVYLDRALRINPSSSMVRYESAMLKNATGQYEAAAEQLEKLVKDDPEWLEPHVELATLYYRLHRPADGAKERQAVERITAEQQAKGPGK